MTETRYSLDEFAADAESSETVHERMIAIIAALPAIGKEQWNEQQKFHYRGHDDMLNALNPLLAHYGVFVVPQVLERATAHRQTSGGKTMYEVSLHVQYTFFGAGGDSVVTSAWGEGTDMGDKATSKAMTMAFKQVLQQSFAVSTAETQDPDGQTAEQTTAGNASVTAPRGWPALIERWQWLFGGPKIPYAVETVRAWMLDTARALYPGTESIAGLDEDQKRVLGRALSAALLTLEESGASLEFGAGVRNAVANALVAVTGGVVVEGPPWALGPDEPLPAFATFQDTTREGPPDATTATVTPTDAPQDEPPTDAPAEHDAPYTGEPDEVRGMLDDIPF